MEIPALDDIEMLRGHDALRWPVDYGIALAASWDTERLHVHWHEHPPWPDQADIYFDGYSHWGDLNIVLVPGVAWSYAIERLNPQNESTGTSSVSTEGYALEMDLWDVIVGKAKEKADDLDNYRPSHPDDVIGFYLSTPNRAPEAPVRRRGPIHWYNPAGELIAVEGAQEASEDPPEAETPQEEALLLVLGLVVTIEQQMAVLKKLTEVLADA